MVNEVKKLVDSVLPEWAAAGIVYTALEYERVAVYVPEEVAKWMVANDGIWDSWEETWYYSKFYIEPLESEGSSYYVVSE